MTKQAFRNLFLVVALVLSGERARAQVRYVNVAAPPGGNGSSWATAMRDLATALNTASGGSEIWVAQGRYVPPGYFVLPSDVRVYGGFQGTETSIDQRDPAVYRTVLDGDPNGDDQPNWVNYGDNVAYVVRDSGTGGANFHMDGFTIRGARSAGAVLAAERIEARGCTFEDNNGRKGMVLTGHPQDVTIVDCVFRRSGLSIGWGGTVGTVRIEGCTVEQSDSTTGAIWMSCLGFDSLEVEGCTFEQNIGGAIHVSCQFPGDVRVENSVFRENRATGGAGIYLYCSDTREIRLMPTQIIDCRFEDNRGCAGAAISVNTGPIVVERCTFRNNNPLLPACGLGAGGALRVTFPQWPATELQITDSSFSGSEHSLLWADGHTDVVAERCTFSIAGVAAAAIRIAGGGGGIDLTDCIVWGDAPVQLPTSPGMTVTARYSNIKGGAGIAGTGNIELDPQFVNAASGDLRLRPGSPCIDAGDPGYIAVGADVARHSRMTDGNLDRILRVDMGAHEASPVTLAITGTPAAGNTLTITTSGRAGLATMLWVDRPGQRFVPHAGTLFLANVGTYRSAWPGAPSTVQVVVPPGLFGLYHVQEIVVRTNGAMAFSNYVPLEF